MNFKSLYYYVIFVFVLLLSACTESDKGSQLADLFDAASLDIVAISFSTTNEAVISVDSILDYTIEGLKSNGVDTIPITVNTVWSLSDGALSSIDQKGRLTAASTTELITINAAVGHLTSTFDVRVSAAKFDQVTLLNSTPVSVNMCQDQQIIPIGNYISDGGLPEQRPVDSVVINTIEWIILNAEDRSASQRARIKTENNIVTLQALETGNVIIQARAPSISQGGVIVTSADFNQTLDNNLLAIKICLKNETDLATCSFPNKNVVENSTVALISVGNYQQPDGSNLDLNISEFSKWGINNSNATIAFSADRQQLDVIGNVGNTTADISVACGKVEQIIQDAQLVDGVVLNVPVTCANGSTDCLQKSQTMNIVSEVIDTLSVSVNGANLVDNTALTLSSRPLTLTFIVTANFTNGTSRVITQEVTYINGSADVVTEVAGTPGEYTVSSTGNDVQITMLSSPKSFIAKITLPN